MQTQNSPEIPTRVGINSWEIVVGCMPCCENNNTTQQRCITRDAKYVISANGVYVESNSRVCAFMNSDGVLIVDDMQIQNKVNVTIFYREREV